MSETPNTHSRVWFSPHGTEWEAETYEEALEMERDALVEQYVAVTQKRDELILAADHWRRFCMNAEDRERGLKEQFGALHGAAAKVLHEYDLWAEDANDGEFAIWRREEFMASFLELRRALSNPAISPEEVTDG